MTRNGFIADMADSITRSALITGGVTISLVAPGSSVAILPLFEKALKRQEKRTHLRKTLKYMKHRRYITVRDNPDGSLHIQITESGRQRYLNRQFERLSIPQPGKWDQKWRLVIFDIPESKKAARNALNSKLKQLGFYQLQRSVWAHPFPCRDEIDLIKEVYAIAPFLTYLETSAIDTHNKLVNHFRPQLP